MLGAYLNKNETYTRTQRGNTKVIETKQWVRAMANLSVRIGRRCLIYSIKHMIFTLISHVQTTRLAKKLAAVENWKTKRMNKLSKHYIKNMPEKNEKIKHTPLSLHSGPYPA